MILKESSADLMNYRFGDLLDHFKVPMKRNFGLWFYGLT